MKSNTTRRGPPVVVKRLVGCARCGRVHRNLSFATLTQPCGLLTHWAPCPTNGEPILLAITANNALTGQEPAQ